VIEAVCVVFVTVVGQVEVCADLHLFGEIFIGSFRRTTRSSDSFEPFRLELRPKMVEDRVPSG